MFGLLQVDTALIHVISNHRVQMTHRFVARNGTSWTCVVTEGRDGVKMQPVDHQVSAFLEDVTGTAEFQVKL